MPGQQLGNANANYLSIVQGNFVKKADKDNPQARKRDFKLKDGTEGTKYEIVFMNWEGIIKGIEFEKGKYGRQCKILLNDAIITLGTNDRYFQDLACKLLSADLSKPILFHPYDMEVDGKRKTGISMKQGEEKLKNYFWDGEKRTHEFPEVDEEKKTRDTYWKSYFMEVEEFLVEKLRGIEFKKNTTPDNEPVLEGTEDIETPTDLPWEP